MKIKHILILLSLAYIPRGLSQNSTITYGIEAQATGTTNGVVPFWMRSNQFGSIPSNGVSGSFIGKVHKDYSIGSTSLFDWGAGFEGRTNVGKDSKLSLIEGYAKVKAGIFQLKAGRTKDVMGLNGDTTLSSGNFSISGNALGIPKIEISIPEYWEVPFWNGFLAIKGTFSHGWLGKKSVNRDLGTAKDGHPIISSVDKATTYFHQKSFYARLGKKQSKLNAYGGFNHQVFWGSEKKVFSTEPFDLNRFESFLHVMTGKTAETFGSKIGNQLGSIDVGIEYNPKSVNILIYRQFIYDIGALAHLANLRDGLYGIRIINKNKKPSNFNLHKILFEVFYTYNQAGMFWSPKTPSGDEDYYNSYVYKEGWTNQGLSLGNPLITPGRFGKEDLVRSPGDYFINNRVVALHLGMEGTVAKNYLYHTKLTYSSNHGTFATSEEGRSESNKRFPPKFGLFNSVNQFSGYLDLSRNLKERLNIGTIIAFDQGRLLDKSVGVQVRLTKSF